MGYYSDPTASMALGSINREFSKYEKKAKRICALLNEGKLSDEALEKAEKEFQGIYRHVLINALKKDFAEKQKEKDAESGVL